MPTIPTSWLGWRPGNCSNGRWLAAELADWLDHAGPDARTDFDRFFAGARTPGKAAVFLAQISERIGGLLDGDRGQP